MQVKIARTSEEFVDGVDYCWGLRRYTNGSLIMDTRGNDGLEVWEAAGAGKRGKKVRLVSIAFPPNAYGDCADINHKLMQAVTACTTIEEVQAAAAVALKRFIKEKCASKHDGFGYYNASYVQTKRGIDVQAVEDVELAWGNEGFGIVFDKQRFRLSDLRDMHNEPRVIPSSPNPGASARRAHEILTKLGQEAVEKMDFGSVWTLLSEGGVRCHYYCALD